MVEDQTAPRLAQPPRPARPLGLLQLLRATRHNSVGTWADAAFDMEISERRMLWRHIVVANAPEHGATGSSGA